MDLLDPLGHIIFAVSNYKRSKEFYTKLFEHIGYKQVHDSEKSSAWATPEGLGFWIKPAKKKTPVHIHSAPGIHHICFKVPSSEDVDSLYEFLKEGGINVFDAPQKYPEYTKDYYAIFFADPDGIKIEVARYSDQ